MDTFVRAPGYTDNALRPVQVKRRKTIDLLDDDDDEAVDGRMDVNEDEMLSISSRRSSEEPDSPARDSSDVDVEQEDTPESSQIRPLDDIDGGKQQNEPTVLRETSGNTGVKTTADSDDEEDVVPVKTVRRPGRVSMPFVIDDDDDSE